MIQPGRKYQAGTTSYRYSINGQEKDSELNENITTAQFWEYDSRIGKRWNLDCKPTIGISQYSVFSNNPVWYSDKLGDTMIKPNSLGMADYKPWKGMLFTTAPKSLFSQANNRFLVQSFRDQPMSQASGTELNLDFYSVTIEKLPSQFKTAGELFTYLRKNLGSLMAGGGNKFESYDKGEKKIWESSNPNSSIMRFKGYVNGRNIDDADVITTNYTYSNNTAYWVFRPVSNLNIINPMYGGDKGHPLAGNREFGIAPLGSGFAFYTQGVDRMWSQLDVTGSAILNASIFKAADVLWKAVMTNITNEINKLGGKASFDTNSVESRRVDYNQVITEEDKKVIKKIGN